MSYGDETEGQTDDLAFDFDTSAYTKESDISVGDLIPDGKYHAVVDKVENDQGGSSPCFKITFSILAGTVGGVAGRKMIERLFNTEKNKQRMVLFANRLGLIGQGDLGKPSVRQSWSNAVGKQVVIEVKSRKYQKNDGTEGTSNQLAFGGIWKLDDPIVASVPRAGAKPAAAPAATQQQAFDDL
jgi:hypothetical protein